MCYLDRKDNLEDTLEPKMFPNQKEGFKMFQDQIPFIKSNRSDQNSVSSNLKMWQLFIADRKFILESSRMINEIPNKR